MATILDLPPELLQQIFEDGATDDVQQRRSQLLDLVRVSRHFYDVGTPLLYRELSSNNFCGSGQWETGLWARTLLEDGSKASLIRSVTLFTAGSEHSSDRDDVDALCDLRQSGVQYLQKTITKNFEGIGATRDLFLKQCCEEHHLEYVLSIVLARLPNLRTLQLKRQANMLWTCIKSLSDAWAIRAGRNCFEQPLKALKTAYFHAPYISGPCPQPPDGFAVAAGLPSMQTLIAEDLGDTDRNGAVLQAYQDLKPKSTNVKAIILGHATRLLNEHLYRLVGSSKALEVFYYHIGNHPMPLFGMDGIPAALSQQQDSLRHIAIHRFHQDDPRNVPPEGMKFRTFAKLQTLQIDFSAIFGAQEVVDSHQACENIVTALPSSLEILTVVSCYSKIMVDATLEAFDTLTARKDELTPRLHTLRISVEGYQEDGEALVHARTLLKVHQPDVIRDPQILLAKERGVYHSGLRLQSWEELANHGDDESHRNAWKRSGVYAYLNARGCEAKHLVRGDKDLRAFM